MLPDFLHVGSGKCASTWLWQACKGHPEIFVPLHNYDNVNFFTVRYHKGLDWYEKTYFSEYNGEPRVGEFSNSYMIYRPAMERIARHLPDAKLTMILRDPVETIFLGWAQTYLKGKIAEHPECWRDLSFILDHHGHAFYRLFAEGLFYARHLKNIYAHFPSERVLVMIYDDLCSDPGVFLERFFSFLGVDSSFRPGVLGKDVNPDTFGSDRGKYVSDELIEELREMYRPDVEELEELIDRDLSHWR